jgi:alkanesulfonate monooxygenase SsuD/methylene tetrahydromethanopterin reductase-like flavin-dependent oxidoreductase (luciferase family)
VEWTKRRGLQEFAVGGAHPRAIGSPQTVADILEKWIDVADIDGFNCRMQYRQVGLRI